MRPINRIYHGIPAVVPGILLTLGLCGCASTVPDMGNLASADRPAVSAERQAAVAEIREKAKAARTADAGADLGVYDSAAPSIGERRTLAEVRALEAELDALAAATRRSTDPGELAALRKRALALEALRRQAELDGDAGEGSLAR